MTADLFADTICGSMQPEPVATTSLIRPTPADGAEVVLLGATLTGNRGAESMLRAAVQRIEQFAPGTHFTLLSLYPADDREEMARSRDLPLTIAAFPPMQMVAAFPIALVAGALRKFGLPYRWLLPTAALRAIARADLLVDLSGISFVDGRGYGILLYNVLTVLIPRCLGVAVFKYAQAIGPLATGLNRWLARRMLDRVATIVARGKVTRQFIDELRLKRARVETRADAAFGMMTCDDDIAAVSSLLTHDVFRDGRVVAIAPSSVVDRYCRDMGIDYPQQIATFIDTLARDKNYGVVLIPHSARFSTTKAKNNDLVVCRRIAELVQAKDRCLFIKRPPNAPQLRVLIGNCRFIVASRFHAMISALETGVPPLLIGWSHKYAEVLASFELDCCYLKWQGLSAATLREAFDVVEAQQDEMRKKIAKNLPAVMESSLDNARLAVELLTQIRAGKLDKAGGRGA